MLYWLDVEPIMIGLTDIDSVAYYGEMDMKQNLQYVMVATSSVK